MNGPTPGAAVPPFCWPLSSVSDEENLSEYYCFGRKQIQVFSWNEEYRRRNLTYVVKGQVGIRCKHCHHETFPGSLKNVHGRTMNLIEQPLGERVQSIQTSGPKQVDEPEEYPEGLSIVYNKRLQIRSKPLAKSSDS